MCFKNKAFSLLEVLIVLAILASIVALAIPQISSQNHSRKSFFRKLIALDKQLRSLARLQNRTYRINFYIKKIKETKITVFWVDYKNGKTVITKPTIKPDAQKGLSKSSDWEMATKIFRKKQALPYNLELVSAKLEGFKKTLNNGLISIYFFPEGMAQRAVVQFSEKQKHYWSFIVKAFISKNNLLAKKISFKEAFQ